MYFYLVPRKESVSHTGTELYGRLPIYHASEIDRSNDEGIMQWADVDGPVRKSFCANQMREKLVTWLRLFFGAVRPKCEIMLEQYSIKKEGWCDE
jgi:hypothetical protein